MHPNEEKVITTARHLMQQQELLDAASWHSAYSDLLQNYETLVAEFNFIAKVSDRVYNKMQKVNELLHDKKEKLEVAQQVILKQNMELSAVKTSLERLVKERTNELQEAYNDILAINRELDGFVYKAAHDLRGPIARLIGLVNLANLEGDSEQYLPLIKTCAAEMDDVLQRLLQTNIIKQHQLYYEEIALGGTFEFILDELRALGHLHCEVKCFACQNKTLLLTDELLFVIAVKNLILIAAKHAQESPKAKIALHVMETPNSLQIYVHYAGGIITDAMREHLFDLFFRFTPKSDGLELYSSKLAAEKLGGELTLVSSSAEETIFGLILPYNWPNAARRVPRVDLP